MSRARSAGSRCCEAAPCLIQLHLAGSWRPNRAPVHQTKSTQNHSINTQETLQIHSNVKTIDLMSKIINNIKKGWTPPESWGSYRCSLQSGNVTIPRCGHKPDGHGYLNHHHIHPINGYVGAGGDGYRCVGVAEREWFPFEPLRNRQELVDWFIPELDRSSTLGFEIVIGGDGLDRANRFGVDGFCWQDAESVHDCSVLTWLSTGVKYFVQTFCLSVAL